MTTRRFAYLGSAVAAVLLFAGCGGSGKSSTTLPSKPHASDFQVLGPDFLSGVIPRQFSCDGAGVSPEVSWHGSPPGTTELALVVTDHDAGGFVHWIVAGIPAHSHHVPRGRIPGFLTQADNSTGKVGWTPPCPPAGKAHHYTFTLYALSKSPRITVGEKPNDALAAIGKVAIAQASVTATYARGHG